MVNLITENITIWTAAQTPKVNGGRGRGNSLNNQSLHGIKKLRELILELGVRGKLVPQDPNDEPASVLLKKIAKEKIWLIKKCKIKASKPFPQISPDEVPHKIPESWEWVSLGELGDWGAGSTPNRKNPAYYGGNMPWLKSGELRDNEHLSSSDETVTTEALKQCSLRVCQPGDVLIAMYGATIGMLAILENVATTNQAVCACTCYSEVFNRYLFLMLKAWRPKFTRQGAGGAQPNISKVKIINTITPLPPLAEQHRIVAKVDELMALCDQLEHQQTDSNAAHQTLVETLLATLTNVANQREFAKAWQRIANHFDTLFTTEQSIDQLKQTILQLAVMGKLAPQDPKDKPARVLLKRIAKEKARLIKEGKIKKQKPLPEISEDEKPFELPEGWEWTQLGNLSANIHYGYTASADHGNSGIRLLRITDIQNDSVNWETVPGCEIEENKANDYLLENDDILIARTGGTIGKSYLVENIDVKAVFASYLIRVKRIEGMYSPFIKTYLGSQLYWQQLYENSMGTGQPNVNATALKGLVFPIPPLAEQRRIVAKVDELTGLCDALKENINNAQTTQIQLADAIVEQAIA